MAWRDQQARPVSDDQVSLGSYHSDAFTLPCGPGEDDLLSEASHDSFDSYCPEAELPSYRVPKQQGVSQPVFEAWIVYYSDSQDAIEKTTFCGLPVCTRYAEPNPYVSCITEPYSQDDLSAMTRNAFHAYQSAHKRSLPSRLLRGRPKSYEADLDARIQKLPRAVQSELDGLLGDREAATVNRFHKRDWTVAMMREQYRYRFASAEYEEVKKRDKRFWKKAGAKRPSEYFFIIRGGEGRVVVGDKGMHTATRHGNPWKRVDGLEQARRQSDSDIHRFGKGYERVPVERVPPRERSLSPPPRRVRVESEAPMGPAHQFPNPFTPSLPFCMPPPHSPPPPPFGDLGNVPLRRPWHETMPRTCPYISSMGRHPPLPSRPLGLSGFSPYSFTGMPYSPPPPPAPPSIPMAPPPLNDFVPRRPSGSTGHEFTLQPGETNPLATNDVLAEFDFENFLKDAECKVSPQSTGSSRASPPPAPRLSNLTTPTTFSPASSARDAESSVDETEVSTPVDRASPELRVEDTEEGEGSRDRSPWEDFSAVVRGERWQD